MSSGPVVKLELRGKVTVLCLPPMPSHAWAGAVARMQPRPQDAVATWRSLIGPTNSNKARAEVQPRSRVA